VSDPYRWLEDSDSPEVERWVRDQDALARASLSRLPYRDAMADRLRELSYVENVGIPRHAGSRWFFQKRNAHDEKYALWVRDNKSSPDRVLLDPNAWSADGTVSLGAWSVSWDGSKCAYAVKANNSDEATLHVIDVAAVVVCPVDGIEGTK